MDRDIAHRPGCAQRLRRPLLRCEGVEQVVAAISSRLRGTRSVLNLAVPFQRGDIYAALHREGEIVSESETENAWMIVVRLDRADAHRFTEFEIDKDQQSGQIGEPDATD